MYIDNIYIYMYIDFKFLVACRNEGCFFGGFYAPDCNVSWSIL